MNITLNIKLVLLRFVPMNWFFSSSAFAVWNRFQLGEGTLEQLVALLLVRSSRIFAAC